MSKNSSINGNQHPYLRIEAWTDGIQGRPPLAETWLSRTRPALGKTISPAEWMMNWLERESKSDKKPKHEKVRRAYS